MSLDLDAIRAVSQRVVPTNGQPPKGDGPFTVYFRGGLVSGPFKTDQLRWTDTGHAFDVVACEPAEAGAEHVTWNAKSGGY